MSGDGAGHVGPYAVVGEAGPRERGRGVLRLRLALGLFWGLTASGPDGGGPQDTLDDVANRAETTGPTPGLGTTRPVGRRLTGGWAFLLGMLLTGVMGQTWWW